MGLKNQENWIAQAKRRALEQQPVVNKQKAKEPTPPAQKPPPEPVFDIGDLFNKINDEKMLRQQQVMCDTDPYFFIGSFICSYEKRRKDRSERKKQGEKEKESDTKSR